MARGRSRKAAGALAPSLELIIKALEEHHLETGLRRGESDALRALGELAATQVPARGVYASSESDLDKAIDQIANKHLGFKTPRKEFFDATAGVEPFALRDRIESAANHLRTVSDTAQFYAGLAFWSHARRIQGGGTSLRTSWPVSIWIQGVTGGQPGLR